MAVMAMYYMISIYLIKPVNMPDPIWKCFGYGQLWQLTASMQSELGWLVCQIQLPTSDLVPFLQKRPRSCWAKLARF